MRRATRVLCFSPAAFAMILAMSGCGSQSASTASGSTTARSSLPERSAFPVTITRTGGIAGLRDELVVAGDGLVSFSRRTQSRRQCHLTSEALDRLTRAASQVAWSQVTPGSTEPSFPDDLVTMVRSPAGGPVRLEDPKVGAAGKVFDELLTSLFGGTSQSRWCKPT